MMRRSKRERLEAKGWRFGTAQEFLGLSNEESAYVELRLRLADSLRLRRQKRNLSQTELARMVHSSQSRVAKMEGGDPSQQVPRPSARARGAVHRLGLRRSLPRAERLRASRVRGQGDAFQRLMRDVPRNLEVTLHDCG